MSGRAAAEGFLAAAMEQEWMAQSGGRRPFAVTPAVLETVELAAGGALGAAAHLRGDAESPEALLAELRPTLPDEVDPWALRTLRRIAEEEPAPPAELLPGVALPASVLAPAPAHETKTEIVAPSPAEVVETRRGKAGWTTVFGVFIRRRRRR